jgi:T5orf172 domain
MNGTVYFLVNKKMPGLLKVGYTNGPINDRLSQLNSTGVPVPFELGACFLVKNPEKCESNIHDNLKAYRLSNKREFFGVSLPKALELSFETIKEQLINILDFECIEPEKYTQISEDLSEKEIEILLLLTEFTSGGYLTRTIHERFFSTDKLDIEYYLANLKSKGFVVEKYDNYHEDRNWRITSEGIQHLYNDGIMKINL